MKKIILIILNKIIIISNKIINYLNRKDELKLISLSYNDSARFLLFEFSNNNLKNYKLLLESIYTSLMNNERFTNFGFNKVIITSSVVYNREYSFHHNVLINNNTTFEEYYEQVSEYIDTHYDAENSYGIDVIPVFRIKVWNMDKFTNRNIKLLKKANNTQYTPSTIKNGKRSYSTKSFNNNITPLKKEYSYWNI
jgi:hypothetical protein